MNYTKVLKLPPSTFQLNIFEAKISAAIVNHINLKRPPLTSNDFSLSGSDSEIAQARNRLMLQIRFLDFFASVGIDF